jgi:hypothetical protein
VWGVARRVGSGVLVETSVERVLFSARPRDNLRRCAAEGGLATRAGQGGGTHCTTLQGKGTLDPTRPPLWSPCGGGSPRSPISPEAKPANFRGARGVCGAPPSLLNLVQKTPDQPWQLAWEQRREQRRDGAPPRGRRAQNVREEEAERKRPFHASCGETRNTSRAPTLLTTPPFSVPSSSSFPCRGAPPFGGIGARMRSCVSLRESARGCASA